jgi:hypothetical protein
MTFLNPSLPSFACLRQVATKGRRNISLFDKGGLDAFFQKAKVLPIIKFYNQGIRKWM